MVDAPSIRLARGSDRAAIERLLTAASLTLDGVADVEFYVAERARSVVGCAGVEVRDGAALLRSVAVDRDSRGEGIGERLVQSVLDDAAARKLSPVVLLTATASAWFPRFGFAEITRSDVPASLLESAEFRGACPDTAVIMRR